MSKKDPRTNKNVKLHNNSIKDCRDTELTFLKKVNEDYQRISAVNGKENGGKRNR